MKNREKQLIKKLLKATKRKSYIASKATEIVEDDKQLLYYLEKWAKNGWWDWGVTLRSGWFTPEGIEHFTQET